MALLDDQLDPGYDSTAGLVQRRGDTPLDPTTAYTPGMGQTSRVRRAQTPMRAAEAYAIPAQTASERTADRLASAITRNLNYGRDAAEVGAQTVMGGQRSALPLGFGLKDFTIAPGAYYWAADSGQRAGEAVARGDYGTAALEAGLGAALPMGLVLRGAAKAARAEDAIDRALRANGLSAYATPAFTQGFGNQRGSLAGPRALTADLAALDRAKRGEAAGRDMDEIQKVTGWRKDETGKWFFEISDKDAKFNPTYALRKERGDDMDAAKFWHNVYEIQDIARTNGEAIAHPNTVESFYRQKGYRPTQEEIEFAVDTTPTEAFNFHKEAQDRVRAPITFKLGDIFQHPELYAAYPKMADMPYEMASGYPGLSGAHFDQGMGPATGVGGVRTRQSPYLSDTSIFNRMNLEDLKSTALHEVGGHTSQFIEGMDKGASPQGIQKTKNLKLESAMRDYKLSKFAYDAAMLRQANPGLPDHLLFTQMQLLGMDTPFLNDQGVRAWVLKMSTSPSQATATERNSAANFLNIQNKYPVIDDATARDWYYRNVGETQARNVQARMNLSQQELRDTPFPSTYDARSAGKRLFTQHELFDPNYIIDPATGIPRPNQSTPVSRYHDRTPPLPYSMGKDSPP